MTILDQIKTGKLDDMSNLNADIEMEEYLTKQTAPNEVIAKLL